VWFTCGAWIGADDCAAATGWPNGFPARPRIRNVEPRILEDFFLEIAPFVVEGSY